MQRSSLNIASMSEVQNLQVFLAGTHSLAGFEGAPKNIALDVASPIRPASNHFQHNRNRNVPLRNYIGGNIQHESFGAHSFLQATLGYNHRMIVGENASFTFGMGGGINSHRSDYGKLDVTVADYSSKETSFAYRVGVRFEVDRLSVSVFNNDNNYFGEIIWGRLWNNQPSSNDNFHGSGGFGNEKKGRWHGQVAVLFQQNTEAKTNLMRFSANAVYSDGFGIGISYQTDKDLSANVSLRFSKSMRIGYAYQLMHLNHLAKKHEIVIRYRLIRYDQ
jgi:hypothetical protein